MRALPRKLEEPVKTARGKLYLQGEIRGKQVTFKMTLRTLGKSGTMTSGKLGNNVTELVRL